MALTHAGYLGTRHFRSLDGIRCLAIVSVLWHHSGPPRPSWLPMASNGFLGVDLFFVLSGFLIVTLLLRERERNGRIDMKGFWIRRTLRIVPLYYLVVLGLAAAAVIRPSGATEGFLEQLPYYLTYTANWVPHEGLLAVAWSLCAEEQFYAIWPPIEAFARRFAWPALAVAIAVNVAMAFNAFDPALVAVLGDHAPSLEIVEATFTPILLGVALARALHSPAGHRALSRVLGRRSSSTVALTVVLLFANFPGDLGGFPRLLLHVAMMAFVASVVLEPDHWLSKPFEWAPIRRIGIVSYGMYLLHMFVHHVASLVSGRVGDPPGLRFVLMLGGTWLLAEVTFRLYERRFLQLKERFSHL